MSMSEIAEAILTMIALIRSAYHLGLYSCQVNIAPGKIETYHLKQESDGCLYLERDYKILRFTTKDTWELMKNWDLIFQIAQQANEVVEKHLKKYREAKDLLSPFVLNEKLVR